MPKLYSPSPLLHILYKRSNTNMFVCFPIKQCKDSINSECGHPISMSTASSSFMYVKLLKRQT